MTAANTLPTTDRSKIKRQPKRGSRDRALIEQILDKSLVIHVGFVAQGQPFVIPMGFGRDGDRLYIHGANASRMLRNLQQGIEICVTATLLDGLVIARSLFHYSMNYRSVVLFGRAVLVEDESEKLHALKVLSEHMVPGSWQQARRPKPQEVKATTVLVFSIEEGSAKVRTGDPKDDAADCELPIWAGQIPLKLTPGTPIPDAQLAPGIAVPENVANYRRG
ncbi:MAG: pyridoxamine 5'-phosphate oxidase family protein [Cyanobacteria bacterium P01_G01_bin.54]